jgi:hypothetical protein
MAKLKISDEVQDCAGDPALHSTMLGCCCDNVTST